MQLQASAEISLYAMNSDYSNVVLDFINRLKAHEGLRVVTNELSTQVTGDYDLLMRALQEEMKDTFHRGRVSAFVIKVLNISIEPGKSVEV